jgi:hypothetical protein
MIRKIFLIFKVNIIKKIEIILINKMKYNFYKKYKKKWLLEIF